jgi:hypothetical protein
MIALDLKPAPSKLRVFGAAALVFFGLLGWWLHAKGHANWALACWIAAGVSGAAALAFPRVNLPLYLALTVVAFPLGIVLSYLVLGLMWYVVITLVALGFRLLGKDPLQRRFDRAAPTYWQAYSGNTDRERYFRQF